MNTKEFVNRAWPGTYRMTREEGSIGVSQRRTYPSCIQCVSWHKLWCWLTILAGENAGDKYKVTN